MRNGPAGIVTQSSGAVPGAGRDARVVLLQVRQNLAEGRALGTDLGLAAGVGTQDGRDSDVDAHARPASRNESRGGRMMAEGPVVGATASRVLRPSPVLRTTVVRDGSSSPSSISFLVTP